jgi:hypothetical protein
LGGLLAARSKATRTLIMRTVYVMIQPVSPLQRKQFVPTIHTADRMTWRTGTQSQEEQWRTDVIYPMKAPQLKSEGRQALRKGNAETYPTVSPHVGVTPDFEKKEPENAYADARKRNRGVDMAVSISMGRTAKRNNLAWGS